MDSDLTLVNETVKRFDKELFAKRDGSGAIRVYHNEYKFREYCLDDGSTLLVTEPKPYHVFSLTDTWGYWGNPVRYGLLPLSEKLRQVSMENRDRLYADLEDSEKTAAKAKANGLANLTENYAREARDVFKEATKDVVFTNMDKTDNRRKYDKRIKQEI